MEENIQTKAQTVKKMENGKRSIRDLSDMVKVLKKEDVTKAKFKEKKWPRISQIQEMLETQEGY